MPSPDAAPAAPLVALLRRGLLALGVALAFVVLGLLFSGDRASAAESDEPTLPLGEIVAPVTDVLDETLDLVDAPEIVEASEIVEAVLTPVEELAAPLVSPVLDTVAAVLPPTAAAPAVDALVEELADPAPLAVEPSRQVAPTASVASVTAEAHATATSPASPSPEPTSPSDAGMTAASSAHSAGDAVTVAAARTATRLAATSAGDRHPPAPPYFPSDSRPD